MVKNQEKRQKAVHYGTILIISNYSNVSDVVMSILPGVPGVQAWILHH